jgi:topoisomerase-4 subunit A
MTDKPQPEFEFDASSLWRETSQPDKKDAPKKADPPATPAPEAKATGAESPHKKRTSKRSPKKAAESATAKEQKPVKPVEEETGGDGTDDTPPHSEQGHSDGPSPLRRMMDTNFLEYAAYVICDRAIPHIDDGLKPVQRRILYSLHERDDGRFTKVANVVGHTMQYHPHGDASIGDALVNLTNKEHLIEGQGNFGNIYTGDAAAAPRYIECRLTKLAREELFHDELTEFIPNYDGRKKEPIVLPSKLPVLLTIGAEGIAVGMSTRIFPHNLRELLEAQIQILRKKPFELLPDFQQGGLIDASEYEDGIGKIKVRAHIESDKSNKLRITQIPAGTTTESLIASIEDAVRKKKVPVRSISDFTAEKVDIELTLTQGAKPEKAIQALYAFTSCESSITGRPVVIRDGRPIDTTVSEIIKHNTSKLVELLERELLLNQKKLQDQLHFKTLVQIFVENRIYKRIEECKTAEAVKQAIYDGFEPFKKQLIRALDDKDVEMLLGVRIRRISLFDINKNREEIEGILAELAQIEKHLASLIRYAINYLKRLLKEYASECPRRSEITSFRAVEVRKLTASELSITYDSERGYIGHEVKAETELFQCSSLDKIVVVWDDGRYIVMPPPDRLFVDKNMVYCAIAHRDKVLTVIYTETDIGFTYMKRFTLGGFIMNREYSCTTDHAKVLVFADDDPQEIYVKYKPAKGQRIHQQLFSPGEIPVKGSKARGNQMTAKSIARIATSKPRWWTDDEDDAGAKGRML